MSDPRIDRFRAMVERFPDRSPPRFSLARALHDADQHAEAVEHYAAAAQLQPDLMMAWLHKGECLIELNQLDAAEEAVAEGLRLAVAQGHDGPQVEARELLDEIEDLRGG